MIWKVTRAWGLLWCLVGRHEDVLYTVGHHPDKECRYCHRPGSLTSGDLQEIRDCLPSYIRISGDDDVEEEARP